LPLGDLNWFPDAMASWLVHQDAIAEHILSLNEDQYLKVGVKENRNAIAFSVYPNPVQDFITVKSVDELSSLRIYSVTGALYKVVDMTSQNGRDIDVSDLSKGVYLLKVKFADGGTYSSKIIKE